MKYTKKDIAAVTLRCQTKNNQPKSTKNENLNTLTL